ncbi:MAG: sulfotransferase [Thermoleophilia bacterium]|nr:sulfotransferase [Thermoleophilia bacterium]MDH5332270.1 sulfotransferase [Thermoleophilia bacterium]
MGPDPVPGHPAAPPLLLLGVRRSGTTLLRVMLDRSSELAIPDESYFVPQLAHHHRRRVDPAAFLDDLRRIRRLQDWGIRADDVAPRLRAGMTAGEAISAVFETLAAAQGKRRWGDKTPLYMQHLRLLERLFPDALYVHLVRDGRDAALSYLSVPPGIMTEGWGHPRDAAGFACQWRTEVEAARRLGRRVGSARYLETSYEDLVADPEAALRRICAFAGLPWEEQLLGYVGEVDLSDKPHQQRLAQPPTPGVRNWRSEMRAQDVEAFEAVAGDLLRELGYEVRSHRAGGLGARVRLARYRAVSAAWRATGVAVQRSPLWRRRHPPLA